MANTTNQPPQPRTVQDYIDERPMWPDGTHLHAFPMTTMQKRIWMLAAAGKFFEGFVVFMTGVALPLIARQFNIGAAQHGLSARLVWTASAVKSSVNYCATSWQDSTIIAPVSVCHHVSYAERYSRSKLSQGF